MNWYPRLTIGLVGRLASGKSEVVKLLTDRFGFYSFRLSRVIHDELDRRGVRDRNTRHLLDDVSNSLRRDYGADIFARRSIEILEREHPERVVLDGVRNPGEVTFLRQIPNFILVGIDADQKIRYQRLVSRGNAWDFKDWEGFLGIDERNWGKDEESTGQQVGACFKLADYILLNNLDSLELLDQELKALLKKIAKDHPDYKEIFNDR